MKFPSTLNWGEKWFVKFAYGPHVALYVDAILLLADGRVLVYS